MASMATEAEKVITLKGTSENPARDPKVTAKQGNKGSIGDKALMDSVILIAFAWGLLLFLAFSLRHHIN